MRMYPQGEFHEEGIKVSYSEKAGTGQGSCSVLCQNLYPRGRLPRLKGFCRGAAGCRGRFFIQEYITYGILKIQHIF
jgi:hypothetical protein